MTADIDKHPWVVNLVARLRADLGADAFDIVDHWADDLDAIGLACPQNHRVLAYVSTGNEASGSYSYELEVPPTGGDEVYSVAGRSSGCTYSELLDTLCSHWNIAR